jgi:hypothetical protein
MYVSFHTRFGRQVLASIAYALLLASTAHGADTWQLSGLNGRSVFAVARDTGGVLYAGSFSSVYISLDTGASWIELPPPPPGTADAFGLAVNPITNHLFVSVEPGLFRSEDAGSSWIPLDAAVGGTYHVVARDDGLLMASGAGGTHLSTDNGSTWELAHGEISGTTLGDGLGLLPSGEFLELSHQSLYRSSGQGHVWTDVGTVRDSGAFIASFAIDRTFGVVYRADYRVIDTFFRIGYMLYRSFDQGDVWERVDSGRYTIPDPLFCDSRGVVWMTRGDELGRIDLYSSADSGATWGSGSDGMPPGASVITFLEFTPGILFAGTADSGLFRLDFAVVPCCAVPGDATADDVVTAADAIALVNHVFKGGSKPSCPAEGDPNDDGKINAVDIIVVVNYVLKSGSPPVCGSAK